MNNPFSYIFVPPVLAPTVLPLPLSAATGLHTLALEQQQQQNLIQSPLVATGLYNSLASDQSVAATNSALVKKAKTQHTIVGKPVMYGNKNEKKPETQVNDGTTAETTSDYASDEHASDVNSESGTLASTDSGRPDSARNGASSLSPRTVESNTNKQNSKKVNSSPVQTPTSGSINRADQSSNNAARNHAKLIYHRKPESLAVGNGNQNKSENRKSSEDDGTSASSKSDGGSQRFKRIASDDNSNPVHSDGSSPAKRVKMKNEEKTSHVSLVSYKIDEPPVKTSAATTNTVTTTIATVSGTSTSSGAAGGASKSSVSLASSVSLSSTSANSSVGSSSSSSTVVTSASNATNPSTGSVTLANDDDMDLDDDGPLEDALTAPPPPPPPPPPSHSRSMVNIPRSPITRKSPATASLSSATVTTPGHSELVSSLATHHPALSFDGAVTTWVSAPTVNSVASANHFMLPTTSCLPVSNSPAAIGGLPSYIHPYAAAAAANQTLTAAPQFAHYQMPGAATHPLAHLNFAQAGPAASAYIPGTPTLSSLPLALRLQNVASLQHAAALQQAAASSYQLQMQAAASQMFAPQHAAAAAQSQLLNQQAAAAATAAALMPQQQVLSIAEEIEPYRMYLQKR